MVEDSPLIFSVFTLIPEAVWGVVIGGIISIVTLLISNWMELKKSRERFKSEVKREAFSKCIDGLTSSLNIIGNMGNQSLDDQYILSEFHEASKKISAASIIASSDTINELSIFVSAVAECFFSLVAKRVELAIAKSNVSIHRNLAELSQGKIDELLEIQRRLNFEGNVDVRRWDSIKQMIENDFKNLDDHNSSVWNFNKELFIIQKSMIKELIIRMPRLGEIQINAISRIRNELGVSGSIESLKHQLKVNQERMHESLTATISKLDEMIVEAEREQ